MLFSKTFFGLITVVSSAFAALQVNTPASLTECQPVLLGWGGGTAPYFVAVIPGGQPSAVPLINFGSQTGTSLTWNVNVTSGTSVSLSCTDATGAIAYSSQVTVAAGTDASCIGSAASVSTGSGSSNSTAASSGASGAAAGVSSTASGAASGATSAASSAASKATSATSGAASSAAASVASSATSAAASAASTSKASSAHPVVNFGVTGEISTVLLMAISGLVGLAWL